jgi:hypothetical protein
MMTKTVDRKMWIGRVAADRRCRRPIRIRVWIREMRTGRCFGSPARRISAEAKLPDSAEMCGEG